MRFPGNRRRGQAMLIAVLALGGAMLGATTIGGFLVTYQIRQSTDIANSARAIFAADAGTEWALYDFFVSSSTPPVAMGNGAAVTVACSDAIGNDVACGDATAVQAVAKGTAGNAARAFLLTFAESTTTTP